MKTTRFHLLHMLTGILVAIFLGIHIVSLHLDAVLGFFGIAVTEPVSWESVMERSVQGLWAALYIALLAVVMYHALYGLRGIILELTPSARAGRIVTWAFVAIGIATFVWGAYVPVALLSG